MRKLVYYITVIYLFLLMISCCKKDDDGAVPVSVESFNAIAIKFVNQDGSNISNNDCIASDKKYAIQIETVRNRNGNTEVTEIQYTINGVIYSMSFSDVGVKRNPVNLSDGKNIAELSGTEILDVITFIKQNDFVLVP